MMAMAWMVAVLLPFDGQTDFRELCEFRFKGSQRGVDQRRFSLSSRNPIPTVVETRFAHTVSSVSHVRLPTFRHYTIELNTSLGSS